MAQFLINNEADADAEDKNNHDPLDFGNFLFILFVDSMSANYVYIKLVNTIFNFLISF